MRHLVARLRTPLLTLCVVGVAGSALASYLAAERFLNTRGREMEPRHRATLSEPHNFGLNIIPFTVEAPDGTRLAAYHLSAAKKPGTATKFRRFQDRIRATAAFPVPAPGETRGTILMFHGRGAIKEDHFPIAERLCAAGFNCIAFDARCSGESGGEFATYGHLEKHDASAILNTATTRFGAGSLGPVAAFGISRGGAEALQTAAADPRITAVITVSTFSDLGQLMHEVAAQRLTHLARPLVPLVRWWCQARAGFNPADIIPLESASALACPTLFIHGAGDTYIPPHHSKALFQASPSPQKQLLLIPGATHSDALAVGGDALYHQIAAFLYQQLSLVPPPPDMVH